MPRSNQASRDAHSAIACLSALHHPVLSGRTPPSRGRHIPPATLALEGKEAERDGMKNGLSSGRRSGGLQAETLPRAGVPSGTGAAGAAGGRRRVSPRPLRGAAPVTHILRVPLVHRRQWRPGRHFVRAAGSGRGLAGRAEVRAPGIGGTGWPRPGRALPQAARRCNKRPRRAEGKRPRRKGRGTAACGGAGDAGGSEGGLRARAVAGAGRAAPRGGGAGGGVRDPLGSRGRG